MLWALLAVPIAFLLLPRPARRRREPSGFVPFGTVSILRLELDPRRVRRERPELDAASGLLLRPTAPSSDSMGARRIVGIALLVAGALVLALDLVGLELP